MGRCLVIRKANFSEVALDTVALFTNSLYRIPILGVLASDNGSYEANNYYCCTEDFYEGFDSITVASGYVFAIRLYDKTDGHYIGYGGIVGMVSGTLDLTPYKNYKLKFVFSIPGNTGGTYERVLTSDDTNKIFEGTAFP